MKWTALQWTDRLSLATSAFCPAEALLLPRHATAIQPQAGHGGLQADIQRYSGCGGAEWRGYAVLQTSRSNASLKPRMSTVPAATPLELELLLILSSTRRVTIVRFYEWRFHRYTDDGFGFGFGFEIAKNLNSLLQFRFCSFLFFVCNSSKNTQVANNQGKTQVFCRLLGFFGFSKVFLCFNVRRPDT